MDRDSSQPLSTEEAKARLRAAARELSLSHWLGRRTWSVLAVAVVGGFAVGRLRISVLSRTMLLQRVAPLLLAVMLRRNK
jgi:nitrate reductase NapE component